MSFADILKKLYGSKSERDLRAVKPILDKVVAAYERIEKLTEDELTGGAADILALLVKSGLGASRSDARRNVQQGGVTANDEKVDDIARSFTADELRAGVVLRRGKKNYNRVILK